MSALSKYYRTEKLYITLPSGSNFYKDEIIELNDDGEIGILPMTASDEVTLKSPDAILNGDAICKVIKSCVPSVKNPKKLISNDIDVIMVAIRNASHAESVELSQKCPSCGDENLFEVHTDSMLSSIEKLESEYLTSLKSGIDVYLKPFDFETSTKALKAGFDQAKLLKLMENDSISEEEKMIGVSRLFNDMAMLSVEFVADSISKIVIRETKEEVRDHSEIFNWVKNIEKETYTDLDKRIGNINRIGLNRNYSATCKKCKHEWDTVVEFNPMNFFMGS